MGKACKAQTEEKREAQKQARLKRAFIVVVACDVRYEHTTSSAVRARVPD